MLIQLSNTSPQPLREQIVRRLRELILRGELPEHTQLPSIRVLARQLRGGVVTVQRAYEDLEREKAIYARQGKGYFVAPIDGDSRRDQARRRVEQALHAPLRDARRLGLSDREIERIVRTVLKESERE
jgi:GntR family transcriptional regulator